MKVELQIHHPDGGLGTLKSAFPVKDRRAVREILRANDYYGNSIPREVGEEIALPGGGWAILVATEDE